jgi:hypothetical protein
MNYVRRCRPQGTSAYFSREPSVLRMERIDGWAAPRWIRQEISLSATVRRAAASIRRSAIRAGRQAIRQVRWEPKSVCWKAVAPRHPVSPDGETTQPCASIRAMTAPSGMPTNIFRPTAHSTGVLSSGLLNSPAAPEGLTSQFLQRRVHSRSFRDKVRPTLSQ